MTQPFWQRKTLEEMTQAEWESLCDGCGQCCAIKLEFQPGLFALTCVTCRLLDTETCRCTQYERRKQEVEGCLTMTPEVARSTSWLPYTCAYRRLAKGPDLPEWHPLVSGDPNAVHDAGVSMRGYALSELDVDEDDLDHFIIRWLT